LFSLSGRTLVHLNWRHLPPVLFVLGSIVGWIVIGIPFEQDTLFGWLLVGLGCFSVADMRGYFRGLVRDWLPFFAVLWSYDLLRGSAGRLLAVHFLPQIDIDRWLFGGQVPTVTLQRWLWNGHVAFWDVIPWAIYMTHFFFTPVLAAVLWKRNHSRFRWFVRRVIALSFAGLATYALFPAAPPWLASKDHLIAPIARIIPAVWRYIPLHGAGSLAESGYAYANNVAAVPSLHAAFSLLIAVTIWPHTRKALRPVVAAYPLAMAFTVVFTGEHYFFDVILGWIYTGGTLAAFRFSPQLNLGRTGSRAEPAPARTG
jgi:hypothetical protein